MQIDSQQEDGFHSGIPNEEKMPVLHAISARRGLLVRQAALIEELNEQVVAKMGLELKEAKEKLNAVLKLALAGDVVASEYIVMTLISKVHTRH
eukprot:CAMPEP_0202969578 /NCGR_PEP_ID=MMETSP1396-20130829/15366_1 /ASSEMBLY_ACC=CAM_ASM_000872 /TAXON_ID= /ORGANISM="Pseudokeronopsis sp., Strain Brazil" /LENGTH=93 /DNA_ID=CAMNT_0049697287 /DNA_START=536 /DNA_END=817 /DNA_ORIENTATION=+